jgi:hypothetical protein
VYLDRPDVDLGYLRAGFDRSDGFHVERPLSRPMDISQPDDLITIFAAHGFVFMAEKC